LKSSCPVQTHTTTSNRTRAQVLRDRVKIRLALDEAGPAIGAILEEHGVQGLDWSRVFPHWLIATVGDDVIGCVQVLPSRPIGYANFLHVKKSAPFKHRAIAVDKLVLAALSSIQTYGAQWACANVAEAKFVDVLKRRNFVQVNETAQMMKRL
jgi:hypothetical protein